MTKLLTIFLMAWTVPALAADGLRLENVEYPFPVMMYKVGGQAQELEMAYMDVPALNPAAEVVVLLHGKNFSGAYWKETALGLRDNGYRVIIPDQLGFGKSSKPDVYQFTFAQLASNTRALLASLGITNAHLMGHSMGGMLATRYALMFPTETKSVMLVNPIGLEDWKAKGVPYLTIDQWYQDEVTQTAETMRAYQKENYYHGVWMPEYESWVELQMNFVRSSQYPRMARIQAMISEMIYTQPVCYEFDRLAMPVLLVIGQLDRTALGKKYAPAEARMLLGNYPVLGREAVQLMPRGQLAELEGLGHLPHVEAFQRFITPVKQFLNANKLRSEAAR